MHDWQVYLDRHEHRFLEDLFEFLRIPSISALSEHRPDIQTAAEWVMRRLTAAGLEGVRLIETGAAPAVYGESLRAAGRPTVLIYGHYDTQPVDPLELWVTPPFEPAVREGRVYARGACDDKGNMLIPILAIEALLQTAGALPVNVKCIFEGEEEIGSPHLPACLEANRDLLACDVVISADGGQWTEDQPALLVSLKGICGLQVDVEGATQDLHSGSYGGAAPNPIHALAHILASMRDASGKITVEGFYDDVVELSAEDRERLAAIPFDEQALVARLGVEALVGEAGYTALERMGARPTLEVNGIWGGFQGEGTKTIIPSSAHAKITCRLVANQDPETIVRRVAEHIRRSAPAGVRVRADGIDAGAYPYAMPADHWAAEVAARVLTEIYGRPPLYVREGGSVPATAAFLRTLGAYTVTFAFGLNDEQFHAPNEFFRLSSFRRGQVAYCRLLEDLGAAGERLER